MVFPQSDCDANIVPVQKLINHYKHSLSLYEFRTWLLGGLHERLKKMPKNPRTIKSQARKNYMLKIADYFGITEDKPFSGIFYFETITADKPKIKGEKIKSSSGHGDQHVS